MPPGNVENNRADLPETESMPAPLEATLANLRKIAGADAVQLIRFQPQPTIIAAAAPSPQISENLLLTVSNLPQAADGASTIVNTYRFAGRLVHLVATECGVDAWLLIWLRLPEGAPADHTAALAELAAKALATDEPQAKTEVLSVDTMRLLDGEASRENRLRHLCQWLKDRAGAEQVLLARKTITGWKLCAASGSLPNRTGQLAYAALHSLKEESSRAAQEEIRRLTEQAASAVYRLGSKYAVILAGPTVTLTEDVLHTTTRLLPLLDPHLTPLHSLAAQWSQNPASKKRLILGIAALIFLILLFPVHLRIRSEVVLEPSSRRFISAPFNGVVKKVHSRAGDVVAPGQLLVELDGREVSERLADVEARLASAILQNTTELEASNYSEAAIRALDAEGLAHERDLLRHRQENLKLYSPLAGVIVAGELERAEGAAVELGKALLELAPLDVLIAEIAIEESDISLAESGMPVSLKLNALPGKTYHGNISRISPRSETRDGKNIFVAEVELPNPDAELRPGMKGKAVVLSWKRPLIWTLVRKPWQVVQRWSFR